MKEVDYKLANYSEAYDKQKTEYSIQLDSKLFNFQSVEHGDLRLTVIEANNTVKIGEPFNFTCRVTNTRFVYLTLHELDEK